jgi:SAM-dependent methyltransferase
LPLEDEAFDLVTSATAFHWITPAVRYVKSARALRKTGTLALFWNRHPRPYTGFFEEVQSIYSEVVPEWPSSDNKLTDEAWIQETRSSILASGFFGDVKVRMYPWTRVYGSDDYIRLLSTYSDHITLPEVRRNQLFEGIKRLIDEQFGGSISRPYLSVLFMTHKLES